LETTSQTVTFVDNAEGEVVMAGSAVNAVAKVDGTDDLQLGSYLSRPTQLATFPWTTANAVGLLGTVDPWNLFLSNASIRRKIDNFAFIRGKLHIKVLVNGTPFQAGLLRACYEPLHGYSGAGIRNPQSGSLEPTLVSYSQMPGFFITPAANAGGQMELPFFYHKNWLDLTSAADVAAFGRMYLQIYAPLIVAVSGGTTGVTVQVFGWMTDIELMCSTSKLALQGDEYDDQSGVVSRPASAVANIASYLTQVPYIGPFARATAIGARAVGTIAKLFGYTNVPVIADVHGMIPMNAPMLASGHIGTAVQKFSLDPKQELSIDPTLHGLHPKDELSLPYLKAKESYLGAGTWSTSTAVDTLLWCARVNPALYQRTNVNNASAVTVGQRVYHTPLSYISHMFYNWRGSLVFRIKIVATKFHKGRLKISYDPVGDITSTNPDVNTVYTKIVDIGEEDDIEIEVPYHQSYPWLGIDKDLGDNWNTSGSLPPRERLDNGVLTIRVLTALTAPTTGSIRILAFLKGGDDFEFANPSDHIGGESSNRVPSFFALQAEDLTSVMPNRHVLGSKAVPHPDRYSQNFGEAVNSLRCLLHRYTTQDTVWVNPPATDTLNIYGKILRIMPYSPGFDPSWNTANRANNVVAASGDSPYAFNTMAHMPYVASMYVGYRGGANFVVTPSMDKYGNIGDFRVTRWITVASSSVFRIWGNFNSLLLSASSSQRSFGLQRGSYLNDGLAGMAITSTVTNGSISFQLPDFKLANFSFARPENYANGIAEDGTNRQAAFVQFSLKKTGTADDGAEYVTLQTQVSAAPDFTCLFWLCCPTLDYLTANPTPKAT
jgi:hypothetical protein